MIYIRLKVCFKCREYITLLADDFLNNKNIAHFDSVHSGHPVQIVNKEELEDITQWKKSF
ncbi:MAG: hypothetical protein ACFFC1_22095 [Promethearchaeota archaeon]